MGQYERKDRFYQKAKEEGYVSRAAYKLIELDRRFGILKPGSAIVDLGCAPGGWLQVISSLVARRSSPATSDKPQATIVGIDLLPLKFEPSPNVHFIQGDFLDPANKQKVMEALNGKANWVLSDMSPNLSGIPFKDQSGSQELCEAALGFALQVLKPGGGLVVKIFPGIELKKFKEKLKKSFSNISDFLPEATRKTSNEIYLVARGFNIS